MQDHGPGEGVYEGQGEGEQGRVNHTYTLHEYRLAYTVRMFMYNVRMQACWKINA